MNDSLYLYINAILWLFTLTYWWKKKHLNVGVIVLLLYTSIACVSCHLYHNPDSEYFRNSITFFPLLYLYVVILLLIIPLFGIDYDKIITIKLLPINVINLICIFIVVCAIYQLIVSLPEIKSGLYLMILDDSNAVEAYLDTTEANLERKSLSGSVNLLGVIISTGVNFSLLFFFIYLLYPNKNRWVLMGMIIALLITPVTSLASGSREKIIATFLVFVFMYILLRPLLSKKINRTISLGATFIFIILFSFFIIISIGRAKAQGNIDNIVYGFERYFGMSFLEFDKYCMTANGTREGNLVSPLINVLLGGRTYSQTELRSKYAYLGVDNGTFYTFVGDFVLDYGPILAFVILLSLAFLLKSKLKVKTSLTISHIVLYYALLKLLSGFYLHQYPGVGGNLLIIELGLLYIFFTQLNLKTFNRT